jgi:hypothetical protein
MLIRTVFLVFVSCLTFWSQSASAKDDGWETVIVREQHPRVTAKYRVSSTGNCFTPVTYEVWLRDQLLVKVDAELCITDKVDALATFKKHVGWSAPYLSIRESCTGNNFMCSTGRALIWVTAKTMKRIGTFTDFVYLSDQVLITSALQNLPSPFVGESYYEHPRYLSTVTASQLKYSKDMTWLLNHEKFVALANFVDSCAAKRMTCKSFEVNSALLFLTEVATITERNTYLKGALIKAESILSPQEHRNFLEVVRNIEKPKP